MSNEISSALLIMLVGMLTVFCILAIIIACGNALIRLVNFGVKPQKENTNHTIPIEHQVVISTVIHEITEGKASDIKIEKL